MFHEKFYLNLISCRIFYTRTLNTNTFKASFEKHCETPHGNQIFFIDPTITSKNCCPEAASITMSENTGNKKICSVENPDCFSGYGSQCGEHSLFYRTTSKEYGWYAPDYHTIPSVYYPLEQKFSNHLHAAGMYRNHSLNTNMDTPKHT